MTIVETALRRARELASKPALEPDSSASGTHSLHRPAAQSIPAPVIQPPSRIRPRLLQPDVKLCRENRLLMTVASEKDGGAIAAYRMLRTRILHRVRASKWVTIGITSVGPNEGKTLTALNLSFSLAREKNSEVVLLDLDMRNPSVCRTLGVQPAVELRTFFEGQPDPQDLFFSIGTENLVMAGHMSASENASELLASNRFDDLVAYIKQSTINPIVLIDLPPVLSTDDALVLAPRLDAILLVVAEGKTDRAGLQKATELLSEFQLAGLVLNHSTEKNGSYSYGYGANYGPG